MNENAMLMKKNKALHFSSYQDSVIGSFANKVVCKHLEEIPGIQFLQPWLALNDAFPEQTFLPC